MKTLNRHRVHRLEWALRCYNTAFEPENCLIDFLADARHWCDQHGYCYTKLDRKAFGYYLEARASARKDTS